MHTLPVGGRDDTTREEKGNPLYAALARTMTRSIALYFSRPVRLFRPPKVSGWQSLKGLAMHDGVSLTPQYISSLVKRQGFTVIPKHFIPPMAVNAALGLVLWTTYTETSGALEPYLGSSPTTLAAISGATAGGAQALAAAPAENVRLVLEGGTHRGWSHAWKEVFRNDPVGLDSKAQKPSSEKLNEIRRMKEWAKEVRGMAGQGWNGWGWGCVKDAIGFSAFFSVFELTRWTAMQARISSQAFAEDMLDEGYSLRYQAPRIVHGFILVSGGVLAGLVYDILCRPWDITRKEVNIARSTSPSAPIHLTVKQILRERGLRGFFRDPTTAVGDPTKRLNSRRRKLDLSLRTLARVGPWGVGFLVWEVYGTGFS